MDEKRAHFTLNLDGDALCAHENFPPGSGRELSRETHAFHSGIPQE
jgi:hypothetical protein